MARANPSWAIWAIFCACALVRTALVATTPMVVFCPAEATGSGGSFTARFPRAPNSDPIPCLISQKRPVAGSMTEPRGFTATIAATMIPEGRASLAVSRPPLIPPAMAPVPAPTDPRGKPALPAASQAAAPHFGPIGGTNCFPRPRSKRAAAGTMGATWPSCSGNPQPFFSSRRTTPSAVARP